MLRWRLLGIDFCIQPSFWLMSALFGYLVVAPMRLEGVEMLKYIAIWIGCTLLSVMVHELGHAVTGRIFGLPGNITLAGMGGQAVGNFETLKRWQRVLVILAGPGAGFFLLFLLILVNQRVWNLNVALALDLPSLRVPWTWDLLDQIDTNLKSTPPWSEMMKFLCWMNLFWNIINLIPIIPLDGGMLMREGCTLVAPRHGDRFAFGLSFVLALAVTGYCLAALTMRNMQLYTIIDPFFGLLMFGMMAVSNFFSMIQARAAPATPQRSPYHQDD